MENISDIKKSKKVVQITVISTLLNISQLKKVICKTQVMILVLRELVYWRVR